MHEPTVETDSALTQHNAAPHVACVLQLARALLAHGLPVHRVEESVLRLSRTFGQGATVLGLPTTLSISLSKAGITTFHMVRGEATQIDLGRLSALHALVGRLERNELSVNAALLEIESITRGQKGSRRAYEPLWAALVGAGGAQLLGGAPRDSAAGAALATAVALLTLLTARSPHITRIVPVTAAAAVTLACAGLAHGGLIEHPLIVTLSALLVILPGLTFTRAAVELGTGHMVCGSARLITAAMTFLQLGFGVLLGVRLGALVALTPVAPVTPPLWLELLGAAVLGLGFCGLLSVPVRDASWTVLVCGLAWGVNRLLGPGQGPELAALLAVICVGVVSNLVARKMDRPSSLLLVPGISMLVPGSLGLLSISSALLHDAKQAWWAVMHLSAITMALSTGVLVAAALVPPRTSS